MLSFGDQCQEFRFCCCLANRISIVWLKLCGNNFNIQLITCFSKTYDGQLFSLFENDDIHLVLVPRFHFDKKGEINSSSVHATTRKNNWQMTSSHHVQSTDQLSNMNLDPSGNKVLVLQFAAPCIQVLPSILHLFSKLGCFMLFPFSRFAHGMHNALGSICVSCLCPGAKKNSRRPKHMKKKHLITTKK